MITQLTDTEYEQLKEHARKEGGELSGLGPNGSDKVNVQLMFDKGPDKHYTWIRSSNTLIFERNAYFE